MVEVAALERLIRLKAGKKEAHCLTVGAGGRFEEIGH
jgi:hypothetical protein